MKKPKNQTILRGYNIMEILDAIITGLIIYLISFILIGWISYAIQDITQNRTNTTSITLLPKEKPTDTDIQDIPSPRLKINQELETTLQNKTVRELKRELKKFQIPIGNKRKKELVKCLVQCYNSI
jgi:hypothetical protein